MFRKSNSGPAEISTDGRTVWINGANGSLLGRLGPIGIDVHHADPKKHCIACSTTPQVVFGQWEKFVTLMKQHHAIEIPKSYRPEWCK